MMMMMNWAVECRCGRYKSRFWAYIWLHCVTACCQRCNRLRVINMLPPDHGPASCDTYCW